MIVVNHTAVRKDFKDYCDQVIETDQPLIVTRKDNNVVMISLERFNHLERHARNAEYIAKLTCSYEQAVSRNTVDHDLIEVD